MRAQEEPRRPRRKKNHRKSTETATFSTRPKEKHYHCHSHGKSASVFFLTSSPPRLTFTPHRIAVPRSATAIRWPRRWFPSRTTEFQSVWGDSIGYLSGQSIWIRPDSASLESSPTPDTEIALETRFGGSNIGLCDGKTVIGWLNQHLEFPMYLWIVFRFLLMYEFIFILIISIFID